MLGTAWLIPSLPLLGSAFVGILLLSFSRTMNRLTKPVAFLISSSVFLSGIISFVLYKKHLAGDFFLIDLTAINKSLSIHLYIDELSSLTSFVLDVAVLIVMIYSFYSTERREGFVRYFITLGLLCGLVLCAILSGNPFHNLFNVSFSSIGIFGIL